MPIGLLLADDHPIFRQGLKVLLEKEGFKVLAECEDGIGAVRTAEKLRPDIAILDLSMPLLNGLDATREILAVSPRTRVIILTVHQEEEYVTEALKAGVTGYVLKSEATSALDEAIREAYKGNGYRSPSITHFAVASCNSKTRGETPTEVLNPRELQVLQLIAEGNSTREIAERLNLTVKIAEGCRTKIISRLNIHEAAGLVRYAVRRGLVKV